MVEVNLCGVSYVVIGIFFGLALGKYFWNKENRNENNK